MKYFLPKGTDLSTRYFALQEREILGYSILPLFEEYEFLRVLKSTGDTSNVRYCTEWGIDECVVLMCIYDKVVPFTSKGGNRMYKLHAFDEYGAIELYMFERDYTTYCLGLIQNEPIMIQCEIKNGFAKLLYLKEAKTITELGNRGWVRVDMEIESPREVYDLQSSSGIYRRDLRHERILAKILQNINKGKFTLIWSGCPRIDIDINYGWLRLVRNEGISIQVLESYEEKPCVNLICGLETEEDYIEYEEEIKQLIQ